MNKLFAYVLTGILLGTIISFFIVFQHVPYHTNTEDTFDLIELPGNFTLHSDGRAVSLIISPDVFYEIYKNDNDSEVKVQELTKKVISTFGDDFDFIIFVSNIERNESLSQNLSGVSYPIWNTVQGIGVSIFDNSTLYGSNSKLLDVVFLFDKNGIIWGPASHEIMHTWANYIFEAGYRHHWGFSSVGGQLGGWDSSTLVSLGNSTYSAKSPYIKYHAPGTFHPEYLGTSFRLNFNGGNGVPYAPLELYLMGLIPPDEVPDIQVAINASWVDQNNGTFYAEEIKTISINNIIVENGSRIPSYNESQKTFRAIFVMLTESPISNDEWKTFDEEIQQFTLAGDDHDNWIFNFWEATYGKASIKADEIAPINK